MCAEMKQEKRKGAFLGMFTGKVDLSECFCSEVAHLLPQTRKVKETTVKDKSYLNTIVQHDDGLNLGRL
jgi:hypothetical protein